MIESERRQVTILFADISGLSQPATEIDPEDMHALLGRFFAVADQTVTSFGGTIDKHIGDSVMGVFGAPIAHDDDPERAVRATLAIHEAMPQLTTPLGRPLAVHTGIASGQVLASGTGSAAHREYTVTGESVNLAARFTGLAGRGDIYISDAVYQAAAEQFDCEDAGEVTVKGWQAPFKVWRLRGLRAATHVGAQHTPVGREAELNQARGALDACRDAGRGLTIQVRGEAGIGKTRLVREFERLAVERGYLCHTGRVFDFSAGTGRDTVCTIVRGLLGLAPTSDAGTAGAAAEPAVTHGLLAEGRRVYLTTSSIALSRRPCGPYKTPWTT